MIKIEDLSSMTFSHQTLLLPHDKSHKNTGSIIYSINTSLDSIVKLLEGDQFGFSNNGLYKTYFYDYKYLPISLVNDTVKSIPKPITTTESKKDLITNHGLISDKSSKVKLPMTSTVAADKNLLYDLNPIIDLFTDNPKIMKQSIRNSVKIYFDIINRAYNHDVNGNKGKYKKHIIMVNLDDYKLYKDNKAKGHILNNLLILLKRNDKFQSQFKYKLKILFYTNKGYFLFDMEKDINKSNYSKLKQLIKRSNPDTSISDKYIDKWEKEEMVKDISIVANPVKRAMTGDVTMKDEDIEDVVSPDDKIVDELINKVPKKDDEEEILSDIEQEIFGDEEMKKEYIDAMYNKKTRTKSEASLKRDEELRKKQKDIVIKTKTIDELSKITDIPDIETNTVKQVPEMFENVRNVRFSNFEENYMENLYEKHVSAMITSLNDKSIPVNVVDVKVDDTSDSLNMKETYTVTLEDGNRKRHTLKFNLPIFIDNKFMYINGSKKTIQKQFYAYPVVKTGPDEVQIVTNYNKIFIRRMGTKLSENTYRFSKLIEDEKFKPFIKYNRGSNSSINKNYLTCLDYDEFAKEYNQIKIGKATFIFNAELLDKEFDSKEKSSLDKYLVGYEGTGSNKTPIYYHPKDGSSQDLISLMVSYGNSDMYESFRSYTVGKRLVYTSATIMAKKVPIIILISFFEGLNTVVRKFNDDDVMFTDKKSRGDDTNGDNITYIKFKDGYLSYSMSNIEASILFNGLKSIKTSLYTLEEMNDKDTYIDIFEELYGSGLITGPLMNYYEFMIDPITLDVLQLLHYPTDIVSLIIFANNMLADNAYTTDMDLHLYRLREQEVVSAILYKNISKAYYRYKQTANNPNPVKISMNPDIVIKELMELPTVEDYSTLSPMVELHKNSLVSMKGANGLNLDRAYKADKRAFNDSMVGVCGISTDAGPNCGKIKQLVAEPTVANSLGFMDLNNGEDYSKLTDVNLAVPIEMLTPGTNTHDNSSRNNMTTKQTCHTIPVEDNCPVLVSTGMDQAIHYRTGNDFSVVAKNDGKIIASDSDKKVIIVEYKDRSRQVIDLSPHVVKNGGGGFYLVNQLESDLSSKPVGTTFKKNDILAYDPKFYKEQGILGNRLTMGSLVKVACISHFSTYEDSAFVTKHMSRKMATNITMKSYVILGANANVDYIVKAGDRVNIGDDLIRYETSYDDSELNKLLSNIRDDTKQEIVSLGKDKITSHYDGLVSDIIMYPTVELSEMSPSLKKIVKSNQDYHKGRLKFIKDNVGGKMNDDAPYKMGVLMESPTGVVKPDQYGKVKGFDVGDGVLIEFYITYHDELSDGDKLTAFTANKNTIGYVVKEGYEPYSEFRPYEEISAPVSPSAIIQRNTPSIIPTGCAYKVLIELKRKMYEILTGESYDEVLKQMYPNLSTNKLNTKPVKEKMTLVDDDTISTLESVFNLYKDESDKYVTEYMLTEDSVISTIDENMDYSNYLNNFRMTYGDDFNAIFENNTIISVKDILPGEPIIIGI